MWEFLLEGLNHGSPQLQITFLTEMDIVHAHEITRWRQYEGLQFFGRCHSYRIMLIGDLLINHTSFIQLIVKEKILVEISGSPHSRKRS